MFISIIIHLAQLIAIIAFVLFLLLCILFTDMYKDVVVKREVFKRGEDIWNNSTERGENLAAAALQVCHDYFTDQRQNKADIPLPIPPL